ncbi:MAG: hypothetical protein ABI983_09085 [Acidobacteriota bacterium]
MPRQTGAYRLLTKLFLRQFLENDLVSPDSDRAQLLAIVGASVISLTLFISMFMSAGYAMSRLAPSEGAVLTLSDKFFYISLAMLVTALVAASQWDALSIDLRDAAILQPLPIRPVTLRLAKLTAVALLGAGVAIAVNLFPTIVFPWMLAFAVRQMSAFDVFRMIGIHAVITITSAVFGYLVIIAIRESASALLGPTLFARASPWMQTTTILLLGSTVLLLPIASTQVGQRGLTDWRLQLPSTAFVGVYEEMTREFLADLPPGRLSPRQREREIRFSEIYAQRRPLFAPLAQRAGMWLASVTAIVAIATLLNAFRTPSLSVSAPRRRRRSRLAGLPRLLFPRSHAARAGFDFALATVWRNKTHRLTLACAAAVGLASVLVSLSRVNLGDDAVLTTRLLIIQPLLYGALLVGFRHLVRVPAELRANWAIQIAWRGQARAFATGTEVAAMLTLVVPALLIVMPPVVMVAGLSIALAHALIGLVGGALVLDTLMLSYDKVPFTCTYVPDDSVKGIAPLFVLAFLIGASLFARVELAMLTGRAGVKAAIALAGLLVALRLISIMRARSAHIDFNEGPDGFHQLGLHN